MFVHWYFSCEIDVIACTYVYFLTKLIFVTLVFFKYKKCLTVLKPSAFGFVKGQPRTQIFAFDIILFIGVGEFFPPSC